MIETAAVFDLDGNVIHWHLPPGRAGGWIPDSRNLWDVLWENRERLGGVAHTHPWHGEAWPSGTDVTTFAAVEAALGLRLVWPIVTMTEVRTFRWVGPGKHDYKPVPFLKSDDIFDLRRLSEKGE
jgi:hypothetical protein